MILGSTVLGWVVVVTYLVLGLMGVVLAVVRYRRRDLHIAAYALGAYLIGGSFRSPINRYMATVAPVLMLLALATLFTIVRRVGHRHVATALLSVALLGIVLGNLANAKLRIETADKIAESGAIEWGPTHPDAIAMFEAVEELTDPDDVVAAPKARAMVLETGRMAVQVDNYRPIPDDVDLALIVVEHNQDRNVAATLDSNPAEYEMVWQNSRFTLYRPV